MAIEWQELGNGHWQTHIWGAMLSLHLYAGYKRFHITLIGCDEQITRELAIDYPSLAEAQIAAIREAHRLIREGSEVLNA